MYQWCQKSCQKCLSVHPSLLELEFCLPSLGRLQINMVKRHSGGPCPLLIFNYMFCNYKDTTTPTEFIHILFALSNLNIYIKYSIYRHFCHIDILLTKFNFHEIWVKQELKLLGLYYILRCSSIRNWKLFRFLLFFSQIPSFPDLLLQINYESDWSSSNQVNRALTTEL